MNCVSGLNRSSKPPEVQHRSLELTVENGYLKLSSNGMNVLAVELQNKERCQRVGAFEYEGVCCYFTLAESKGPSIRDHYCFNSYLNRVEYMFSDDYILPQTKQPNRIFTIEKVEYGLHVGDGIVEISKNGQLLYRVECDTHTFLTGDVHIYRSCLYFLLEKADSCLKKMGLFNPEAGFFAVSRGEFQNPYFNENLLITVSYGDRFNRFEDAVQKFELLQGPNMLKRIERSITGIYSQGLFWKKTLALEPWEQMPF